MAASPVWEPWVSFEKNKAKKGQWNLMQVQRFLNFKSNATPKRILYWLQNKRIHPENPMPSATIATIKTWLSKH